MKERITPTISYKRLVLQHLLRLKGSDPVLLEQKRAMFANCNFVHTTNNCTELSGHSRFSHCVIVLREVFVFKEERQVYDG